MPNASTKKFNDISHISFYSVCSLTIYKPCNTAIFVTKIFLTKFLNSILYCIQP